MIDNRAMGIACYHPGYTFVEKLQTIIRHHRQEVAEGTKKKNYMRQYYDVASLLDTVEVQAFINDPDYATHKAKWIRGQDAQIPVSEHPAFLLNDEAQLADFTDRYQKTSGLYYRGQIPFAELIARIRLHLPKL